MTFISYAQNFEDVMLWRALKDIENGFYIDVGANDPTVDSVTKAFYDRGWHGVNVEPLPSHHEDLMRARQRDVNLLSAAGARDGAIDLWECDVRGWATASIEVADMHRAAGHEGIRHHVPITTLTHICEKFADGDIHFMKVDVEGFEKAVIDGMDFSRFRPWILVVEATKPNSSEEYHVEWESVVLAAGYKCVYLDGLNRFYLANERSDLSLAFKYPPNVFDGFKLASLMRAEASAQQAETKAQQAENAAARWAAELHGVYSSKSWRITAPVRWASSQARRLRQEGLKSRTKALVKKALRKINRALLRRPNFRRYLIKLTIKLGAYGKLRLVQGLGVADGVANSVSIQISIPNKYENLPSSARQIYSDLVHEIKNSQKRSV